MTGCAHTSITVYDRFTEESLSTYAYYARCAECGEQTQDYPTADQAAAALMATADMSAWEPERG